MAGDDDDDFGLQAYLDIQANLELWDGNESSSSPAPPGRSGRGVASPASTVGGDGGGFLSPPPPKAAAETPAATPGRAPPLPDPVESPESEGYMTGGEEREAEEEEDRDGFRPRSGGGDDDPCRPYRDALLDYSYVRTRTPIDEPMDGGETKIDAVAEADLSFLRSLAHLCFDRSCADSPGGGERAPSEASIGEGNFWALLESLRARGLAAAFYRHPGGGGTTIFREDPAALTDDAPADVVDRCLWGDGADGDERFLPLARLEAALCWVESCHQRQYDDVQARDGEGEGGGEDPLLPPPRRRTMWPATIASLRRRTATAGAPEKCFHPDAPLLPLHRSPSPTDARSLELAPEDGADDARLLRACLFLVRCGRIDDAATLAEDCGQPWRAACWTGGRPLNSEGEGNPDRAVWKERCRVVAERISQMAGVGGGVGALATTWGGGDGGGGALLPPLVYESAVLALLSDDVGSALSNPATSTWEDGVHAVLSTVRGSAEDAALQIHGRAKQNATGGVGVTIPNPGTVDRGGIEEIDLDLGRALAAMDGLGLEEEREGGCSAYFRRGAAAFLAGWDDGVKPYVEECAASAFLASAAADDPAGQGGRGGGSNADTAAAARLLRFATHLVLYVDAAAPDLAASLSAPPAPHGAETLPLKDLLLREYAAHLSSRRELWDHVAAYASLLPPGSMVDTYASFLVGVHSDGERRAALANARESFPAGADLAVLRRVVREELRSDPPEEGVGGGEAGGCPRWSRGVGEEPPPRGVSPPDARRMRSVRWLCYFLEHHPDALVCANMLLRRFLLESGGGNGEGVAMEGDPKLFAAKVFVDTIAPKDLVDAALEHCGNDEEGGEETEGTISRAFVENLNAEFLSIRRFLYAHNMHARFLQVISETPSRHPLGTIVCKKRGGDDGGGGASSDLEMEVANEMELRDAHHKKLGACRIVLEAASRASEAWDGVLSFEGGWLSDHDDGGVEATGAGGIDEAEARSTEIKLIRAAFIPKATFLYHDVLDRTATWLEEMADDVVDRFGDDTGRVAVLALLSRLDETTADRRSSLLGSEASPSPDVLLTSLAAPGCWHRKALSLASLVAKDEYEIHSAFGIDETKHFMGLMAESSVKAMRSAQTHAAFNL